MSKSGKDLNDALGNLAPFAEDTRAVLAILRRQSGSTRALVRDTGAVFEALTERQGQLRDLIVTTSGRYKREIVSFFALDAAATQASDQSPAASRALHYLRTTNPTNPEILAAYPRRLPTNRSNPCVQPGGYDKLRTEGHLEVFGSYLCTSGGSPTAPLPAPPLLTPELAGLVNQFVFGGAENTGATPPCDPEEPLGRRIGQEGMFSRLQAIAP